MQVVVAAEKVRLSECEGLSWALEQILAVQSRFPPSVAGHTASNQLQTEFLTVGRLTPDELGRQVSYHAQVH